jgi:hypothetical protein
MNTAPRPALCPQRDGNLAHPLTPRHTRIRLRLAQIVVSGFSAPRRRVDAVRILATLRDQLQPLVLLADPLGEPALPWLYDAVRDALVQLAEPTPDYPAIRDTLTQAGAFAARWQAVEDRQ